MARQPRNPQFHERFGERLRLILAERSESITAVAISIGHSGPSTLYAAMRGASGLDLASVAALAEMPWPPHREPNFHWLLTGHGSRWLAASTGDEDAKPLARERIVGLMAALQRELDQLGSQNGGRG